MGIYFLAIGVLVVMWIITALIYEDTNWKFDISTGISLLFVPIGIICESGILIFIGFVLWVGLSFYLKSLMYTDND